MVPKGANILQKPLTKATKSYAAKRGARNRPLPPFRNTAAVSDMAYLNDPPPISEDAISEGMMSLVTKGLVPKDVDLTPAFEKGAPPVTCKGVKFYDKREQFVRREVATGGEGASNVRFDLQPVQTRILMPIRGTGSAHKSNVLKPIEEEHKPMLALPPSESPERTQRAVVAMPQTSVHQMSTSTKDIDNRSTKMQVDVDTQPRDYNELMDQFSLHQIIIRKGEILDTTPEFISFKRTYLNKWGSVSFILHLI